MPIPCFVRPSPNVNLWRVPLRLSLGSVVLFGLTMIPDTLDAVGVIRLPTWFTMGGIDDARAILGAMMGCTSTVLALIFSVALLVVSMVATLFGPRLLYRFLQDWVTQATLGLFLATFIYLCLVFLVTHQDAHSTFIPQVSLITSWLLVVVSFAFLVYYSHRIAISIQNPDLIARIVDDLRSTVGAARPGHEGGGEVLDPATLERQLAGGATIACMESGYLQEVSHAALVDLAARAGAVLHVLHRPGQFVFAGEPLARVWPARAVAALEGPVVGYVKLGRHREIKQDWEFSLAQIIEIGIRALSPAINDTFTGVACVDWAGDALLVLNDAPLHRVDWHDAAGNVRLRTRPLELERVAKMAFDQIRQAAADNPAVLIRILDTIGRIAPRLRGPAPRAALMAQADAIRETTKVKHFARIDRNDIEAAWARVELAAR